MLCLKTLLHGEHIAAELNSSSVAPSCPPESFLLLFENLSSWERLSPIPLFQEPLAPFQSHASITQPACPASPELRSSVRPRAVRLCPRAFNVDTSCWLNMLQASGPQPGTSLTLFWRLAQSSASCFKGFGLGSQKNDASSLRPLGCGWGPPQKDCFAHKRREGHSGCLPCDGESSHPWWLWPSEAGSERRRCGGSPQSEHDSPLPRWLIAHKLVSRDCRKTSVTSCFFEQIIVSQICQICQFKSRRIFCLSLSLSLILGV